MSVINRVRVISVDGDCLACRVINLCGYCWKRFIVPSRTLALGILWESLTPYIEGRIWYWHNGHEVTMEEAQAFARTTPLGQELPDQEFHCDEKWNRANVGRFISCVSVVDHDNWDRECSDGEGFAPGEEPQATFFISVTHPQWLAHLSPQIEWDSWAYDHDEKIGFNPAWRTSDVMSLATGIERSQDYGAMPILADALQDAGCDSDDLLNHLRDTSATHVRGCWALDLVLGKS